MAAESWDPELWQTHSVAMLQHHFGVDKVVAVPDEDGGDRGLDAFTVDGIGYQCYAPENEPLAPSRRATLQKGKITADLGKLRTFKEKLTLLLGGIRLHTWVLLTPEHRSAAVIEHCNAKASEVDEWGLPFTQSPFRVQVHSVATYARSHAFLTQSLLFQGDLERPPAAPPAGADFGALEGELVDLMDMKLSKIPRLRNEAVRREHRAVLLEGQLGGNNLLDRWRTRTPDIANHFESMIEAARKEMIFRAAGSEGPAEYYQDLQRRLVDRFSNTVTSATNAEFLAYKCISDWLQQCPLDFEDAG